MVVLRAPEGRVAVGRAAPSGAMHVVREGSMRSLWFAFTGLAVLLCAALSAAQAVAPAAQLAYLKAPAVGTHDQYGRSVAISADTVVVGSPFADGSPDPAIGKVFVYLRDGSSLSLQASLEASNADVADSFGYSVSISGDTLVVGAPQEKSNASGVNGDQSNDLLAGSGAAYVFVRSGAAWAQQAYLKASNPGAFDGFGWSVSISGDTIVIGATDEDSGATGVNGNQADNGSVAAGAAYVFVREGTRWTQQAYLKASNTGFSDHFGEVVGISGETIVVAATGEDSNATGVNGNEANNSKDISGAVYVFVRDGAGWSQQAYLKASNTDAMDHFGHGVAISGDTILVGAPREDSRATGVDGLQGNSVFTDAGAAYVFTRSGTSWSQQAYLKSSNTGKLDNFGFAVGVWGDTAVVGAQWEDSNAAGVNAAQLDNSAANSGAAYVFRRNGTSWSQTAYLKPSNTGADDWFGETVAVGDGLVVVAATQEDSGSAGVNGDQDDNSTDAAGAAYAFGLDVAGVVWEAQGSGLAGANGVPKLGGAGTLQPGSAGSLTLSQAKPSAPCALFLSLDPEPVPFKGGLLVAYPPLTAIALLTQADGTLTVPFTYPGGVPAGASLWSQSAISDLAAVEKVALSNVLKATPP
jgi:hypothetical protein